MKNDTDRKKYIRGKLRGARVNGSWLTLLGCLMLLIWAFGEFIIRYDAMDGIMEAYFRLVKKGEVGLWTALKNLWETEEARKDLLTMLLVALSGVCSALGILTSQTRGAAVPVLIFAAALLAFNPYSTLLAVILNYSVRIAGCAVTIAGSVIKLVSIKTKKLEAGAKYDRLNAPKQEARVPVSSNDTAATLLPKRTVNRR